MEQYKQKIKEYESQIKKLNILKAPTLENLDKRNKLLSKIHTLKFKINNIINHKPELGYGIDIDKQFLTE